MLLWYIWTEGNLELVRDCCTWNIWWQWAPPMVERTVDMHWMAFIAIPRVIHVSGGIGRWFEEGLKRYQTVWKKVVCSHWWKQFKIYSGCVQAAWRAKVFWTVPSSAECIKNLSWIRCSDILHTSVFVLVPPLRSLLCVVRFFSVPGVEF